MGKFARVWARVRQAGSVRAPHWQNEQQRRREGCGVPEVNVEDLLPLPKVADDRRQLPCRVGEALGGGAEAKVEAVVGGIHERAEAPQPLRTQQHNTLCEGRCGRCAGGGSGAGPGFA